MSRGAAKKGVDCRDCPGRPGEMEREVMGATAAEERGR